MSRLVQALQEKTMVVNLVVDRYVFLGMTAGQTSEVYTFPVQVPSGTTITSAQLYCKISTTSTQIGASITLNDHDMLVLTDGATQDVTVDVSGILTTINSLKLNIWRTLWLPYELGATYTAILTITYVGESPPNVTPPSPPFQLPWWWWIPVLVVGGVVVYYIVKKIK